MVSEGHHETESQFHDRLVGDANISTIVFNQVQTSALLDTGSMVSTVSNSFYQSLSRKPELLNLSDLGLDVSVSVYSGHNLDIL